MIKAIIFDMDGTILNTIEDITDSVNYALSLKKLPEKSVEDIKLAVGSGAYQLIERVVPANYDEKETKEVYNIYQEYYDQNSSNRTGPYDGILDLLKNLKEKGYKLSVVSNKHEYLVNELNIKMFKNYFDVSIGMVEGIPIKPKPDMLLKAIKLLEVSKDEVVFIGDSDVDILTARNAKITSIGVTWGFRDRQVLIDHQANYIIDSPKELYQIIEGINKL
ncbi:MAG: HAD family hydrolase [Tenericutes bacterium]|nr:HAD family hydrolase [Mycoplasmatota bacterium]